jgi:ribosome-associated translation inhibitor RaiA
MTKIRGTPLTVRPGSVEVGPELRSRINKDLGRRIERYAQNVTRVTVRFDDINGPRGGIDTVCRIKLSVKGADHIVVEAHGADVNEAFRVASAQAKTALSRVLERKGPASRRPLVGRAQVQRPSRKRRATRALAGSLIGRRVGRARKNLEAAWEFSGPGSTAARNTRLRANRAAATLEDSQRTRPSRKSTRKSANRQKSGAKLARRAKRQLHAPGARAART